MPQATDDHTFQGSHPARYSSATVGIHTHYNTCSDPFHTECVVQYYNGGGGSYDTLSRFKWLHDVALFNREPILFAT